MGVSLTRPSFDFKCQPKLSGADILVRAGNIKRHRRDIFPAKIFTPEFYISGGVIFYLAVEVGDLSMKKGMETIKSPFDNLDI